MGLNSDHPPSHYRRRWRHKWMRYPDYLRWKGSVWPSIVPWMLLLGGYTYLVAAAYWTWGYTLVSLGNSIVPALYVVIGLQLAFLANSTYARHYEGRQQWQDLMANIRNLARLIWCATPGDTHSDYLEKMRCIKLLLAFAVSTKHHLRKEYGYDYFDLDYLLPPNWKLAESSSELDTALSQSNAEGISILMEQHSTPSPIKNITPRLSAESSLRRRFKTQEDLPDDGNAEMSLPLEILFRMSFYIAQISKKVDSASAGAMASHLNALNDCLAGMERISNTPIPRAYHIHMKQSLAVFLLSLPLTLVADLGWYVIPTNMMASFTLLGINAICAHIEDPFGYDENDLPLNHFCDTLRRELEFVVQHFPYDASNALFVRV